MINKISHLVHLAVAAVGGGGEKGETTGERRRGVIVCVFLRPSRGGVPNV